jgi:integrase
MATIKLVKDKRKKLRDNKFSLAIRVCHKSSVQYLSISKMSEIQYEQVFVKQSKDEKSISFRESVNELMTKCERIFSGMSTYNPKRFRELVYEKDKEIPKTLVLKNLFTYFIENYEGITLRTRYHFRLTMNILESYQQGLTVNDITPMFLRHFEKIKLEEGLARSTIDGINRNLRRIINYFMLEKKIIPKTYEYPFGRGGYSVKSFFGRKFVMTNEEIQKIVDFKDFDNKEQEYARDIWLFLYRASGINYADLLRMRWSNITGGYIIIFRKKTERTRKNNIKPLTIPIEPNLQEIIDKVGVKDSPFILGILPDGYSEITFENKSHKVRSILNENLLVISNKLKLSVPLKLKTARDCYATTLKRAGVPTIYIGETLGHASPITTEHYLDSLDSEKIREINKHIL